MKKGYYIYADNCGSSGVMKKIAMQMEAFNEKVEIIPLKIETLDRTLYQRVVGLLPWNSFGRDYRQALQMIESADFVYIRRMYVDKAYISFLRDIRRKNSDCKIIIELPVYPYAKEMLSSLYTGITYIRELFYRKRYVRCIDRFVTYSNDNCIWKVQTICTMNGINVSKVIPVVAKEYDKNNIHILAVAMFARHHGYERLIIGLKQYYQNNPERKVYFHLVGGGSEEKKYKRLVGKYKLEKYVIFHGALYGDELDGIYNKMDVGVAALGVYKDGLEKLSTIKAREYIAKGLPVILGAQDDLFEGKGKEYGIQFSNDRQSIDIKRIVKKMDEIHNGKTSEQLISEIRDFAYKNVDNRVTLKPVIDYIEE